MDDRFWNMDYKSLFPEEWDDVIPCRLGTVEQILRRFWEDV